MAVLNPPSSPDASAGLPDRMTPFMPSNARHGSSGWRISASTRCRRTFVAIRCAYWPPKSTTAMRSGEGEVIRERIVTHYNPPMNYTKRFRVKPGKSPSLSKLDPDDTAGMDKPSAHKRLLSGIERLSNAQERLYAQNTWAVLIIFQAMDAAGKDSTIKHVMSGVNPQGCQVCASRRRHRRSWTTTFSGDRCKALPERGRIGIHNRSYPTRK